MENGVGGFFGVSRNVDGGYNGWGFMERGFFMYKIVMVRHGESLWNRENLFTGWTDVDLTEKGVEEARAAGRILREEGYSFDAAYTSVLKRAIRTLDIVLEEMELSWIPVYKSWRLNERHYGALQGLNKAETAEKYGAEQVLIWRRSYDVRPPALGKEDARWPGRDRRYAELGEDELPAAESLKDTKERFLPYWFETIVPAIGRGERVLIAAHGNSMRALVQHLDEVSNEEIVGLNIPTGIPLVYELDGEMRAVKHYYLGDAEAIEAAARAVAEQAGKGKK